MLAYFHALMQYSDDLNSSMVLAIKYQVRVFGDGSVALSYFRAISA